jgi:hypothetical protein
MIKCDYCGRENPDEAAACSGCGTPLAPIPDKPGRPVSVSGLLDCALGVAGIAAGQLHGVIHIVKGLSKLDSPIDKNPSHQLLERAAAMESWNMRRAINLYKQIARDYPGTRAAKEANRNVQTLKATHPELEDFPVPPPNHEKRPL